MVTAAAPTSIKELVRQLEAELQNGPSEQYRAMEVRYKFVAPLLDALGWHMPKNYESWGLRREVAHASSDEAESVRMPDYCLHAQGVRCLYVMVNRLQDNLMDNTEAAFQLRRYAWSANLNFSILTNFRELAVYDCRARPSREDNAASARVLYLTYKDYTEQWNELASRFSCEAVMQGALERYAEVVRVKRSTVTVNAALLEEVELCREILATDIAHSNPQLGERDLNNAVQMIIDRILFLRICEDKGIEPYKQLLSLAASNDSNVYKALCRLFRDADSRYNSSLFHSHSPSIHQTSPDNLAPDLIISNKTLKLLIERLYYPESAFEFSVIPADVLGHVYEQFLGKTIRLAPDRTVKIEEKPAVRKSGGVYYTPNYIVRYMVGQTLDGLLKGKTPQEAAKLKIADPACGAGYFLLEAFEYLLTWHQWWYVADGSERHIGKLYKSIGGEWRLTITERKRILLNNIYGVDVDEQAVEVTKLSLLLKVLEGETQETLDLQMASSRVRVLPDLSSNIKCGNALIGPDYYDAGQQATLLGQETDNLINAFDWVAEFPQVFRKRGGFSAFIGNPPYIRVRTLRELYPEQVRYLETHYQCATHVWDIYLLFFERALDLLGQGGLISYIVPIQTLHQPNCESLRRLLYEKTSIHAVIDLSSIRVFQDALVKNCILICEKGVRTNHELQALRPGNRQQLLTSCPHRSPQEALNSNPGYSFKFSLLSPQKKLCDKLRDSSWALNELYYVTFGLRSCAKQKGGGTKDRLVTYDASLPHAKPYLEGRDIKRFMVNSQRRYIRYLPEEMYSPRSPRLFEGRKIVSQSLLSRMRLVAALDDTGHYVEQSLLCIIPHGLLTNRVAPIDVPLEFVLGVLNSRLQSFYFASCLVDYSLGGGLIHATPGTQSKLLVPRASSAHMLNVVGEVNHLLSLHNSLSSASTSSDKSDLRQQIAFTDGTIDEMICEIYGLTDTERHMVYTATMPVAQMV